MTSIRHSDTVALERRRELVVNELRLIDAELELRASMERQRYLAAAPGPLSEQPSLLRSLGLI